MAYTHEVIHNGFYRRVNGVLTALPVGTKLELSEDQGKRMVKGGLVKPIDQPKAKQVAKPEPKPAPEAKPETDEKPVVKKTTAKKTAKGRRSKK